MNQRSNVRIGDFSAERTSAQLAPITALQAEAAALLTDRSSMTAFQSRMSPCANAGEPLGARAHNIDREGVRGMNASGDQINEMLQANPVEDLFMAMKDENRGMAMDFAVKNQEIQTAALHNTGDLAFAQELRLRLTGTAGA